MAIELDFNEERFVKLLTNLIGETRYLQDNPPKFVPEENRYESYIGKRHFSSVTCMCTLGPSNT